jgi:hypothetical protein
MATSPIYSWPEPDNTDLVKNGALAIRTMGNAIDTTMATMIPKSIVDAKGDLIAATANDTPARLAVGTNGQILQADSAESIGLKWVTPAASSSGLTFITGAAFSAVASVSLPNSTFTSTYTNYKMIVNITSAAGAAAETRFRMRASGTDDTAANYYMGGLQANYAGGNSAVNVNGGTFIPYGSIAAGSGGISSQSTQFEATIFSPQASNCTVLTATGGRGSWTWTSLTGIYNTTTAFDALTYYVDAGTITGNYRVYGIANS